MSQLMTYHELQDWICSSMEQKGFHDDWTGTAEDAEFRIALINTEIGESINEVKRHWTDNPSPEVIKSLAWELADVAIRVFDLMGLCGKTKDVLMSLDTEVLGSDAIDTRTELAIRINTLFINTNAAARECFTANRLGYWDVKDARKDLFKELVEMIEDCADICYGIRYPLLQAIREKMEKNMARPHKYGTPDAITSQ